MKHTNTCWHDSNGLVQKYIGTAYDKIKLVADNLDMLQELVDSTEGIQLIFLLTNKSQLDELNTDYFRVARMYDTDNYEYYDDYMFDLEFDKHGEPKRDEEGKLLGTWNMLGSVFKDTYEDVTNEVIAFHKDKVVDVNVLKAVKIIGAEATSEEFGTVKIFATLGDSEEGTITQKALTDIITIIQKDTKHAVDTAEDALHKAESALDSTVRGIVSDEEGNDVYKANSQRLTNELLSKLEHKNILGREVFGAHPASAIVDESGKSQQQINNEVGYGIVGSFADGLTNTKELTNKYQLVLFKDTNENLIPYFWDGDLPKQVPAGSTPASTGGVGLGAWVGVGDASLRSDLDNPDKGAAMVAYQDVSVADKLDEIVSGAVTEPLVDAKIYIHNENANSHPELRSRIVSEVSAHVTAEADRAELARDKAEDHRDDAWGALDEVMNSPVINGANLYLTTALGIAGTASGDRFWVFPNNNNGLENLVLYTNSSGTAVELYEHYNLNQFMITDGDTWE